MAEGDAIRKTSLFFGRRISRCTNKLQMDASSSVLQLPARSKVYSQHLMATAPLDSSTVLLMPFIFLNYINTPTCLYFIGAVI